MGTSYRILKLKSGEEIITKILGQQKGKFILERPMIFKTLHMMDGYGRQKEITVLKDWLQHTDELTINIPKDYIATFLKPDKNASDLYDLQKEKEDKDPKESKITFRPDNDDLGFGNPDDFLKSLGIHNEEDNEEDEWNNLADPGFIIDSIIQGLIESGDMDRILDNYKKERDKGRISDIYTGDEIDREDFGDKWTDWSSDPEDYLE
tara:strand:- start:1489 stop:2109 length:621 start_codon:yes stop_codon:yes gene_type:complete